MSGYTVGMANLFDILTLQLDDGLVLSGRNILSHTIHTKCRCNDGWFGCQRWSRWDYITSQAKAEIAGGWYTWDFMDLIRLKPVCKPFSVSDQVLHVYYQDV